VLAGQNSDDICEKIDNTVISMLRQSGVFLVTVVTLIQIAESSSLSDTWRQPVPPKKPVPVEYAEPQEPDQPQKQFRADEPSPPQEPPPPSQLQDNPTSLLLAALQEIRADLVKCFVMVEYL